MARTVEKGLPMENETQSPEQPQSYSSVLEQTHEPTPVSVSDEEELDEEEEELVESKGRLKKIGVILVILVLLLLGLLYLAGLRKPEAPPPPKVEAISFNGPWTEIASYSGSKNGFRQTEAFTITGQQWRVIWNSRPSAGDDALDTSFIFFLRPVKKSAKPADNVIVVGTATEPRSATWNVRTPPGKYYINVIARNVDWKIKVEVMRQKAAGSK